MKIKPECVPCLLKRCVYESRLVDSEHEHLVVKEAMEILNELFDESAVSAEIATKVHKRVYSIIGDHDPYKDIKKECNVVSKNLIPKARKFIENGDLREAIIVAIIGNVMDFGYKDEYDDPEYLSRMFDEMLAEGLGYDDVDRIEEILQKAEKVVYFTDNAGEIVLDTLLVEKLKEYDIDVTVVVKGEPVLTDATMEDALEVGIDKVADRLDTTGGFAIGVDLALLNDELKKEIEDADLIIAKGMANWESLSETDIRPIAYLTRSKCHPVADSMGVPYDVNAAKLFE